ncbi:hypothetical protein [Streptomyces roseochromogenus]|uniref:hypothetical protein n=1 Tax=Streptomyces roseochromogenus TaxID=285450 RepID=UPI000B25E500|nr:hypothetical protein [Streptomyces roseochromogenus]
MTAPPDISTVGIVGGSLGGLFHAVALTELGLNVHVWERSTGRPDDRGAGIVLQPSVAWFLSEFTASTPTRSAFPSPTGSSSPRTGTSASCRCGSR